MGQRSSNLRNIKKRALKKTFSTEVNKTLASKSMMNQGALDGPEISRLFQQLDQEGKNQGQSPDGSLQMQSIQEESYNSSVSGKSDQDQATLPPIRNEFLSPIVNFTTTTKPLIEKSQFHKEMERNENHIEFESMDSDTEDGNGDDLLEGIEDLLNKHEYALTNFKAYVTDCEAKWK